jgi:hypothetical protein
MVGVIVAVKSTLWFTLEVAGNEVRVVLVLVGITI